MNEQEAREALSRLLRDEWEDAALIVQLVV